MISPAATPRSAPPGIVWPGLPPAAEAQVLALLFQLQHSERWPPDLIAERQRAQLNLLLDHAAATVPYYAERLAGPAGTQKFDSLRDLPILTRGALQQHADALTSTAPPPDHGAVGEVRSSGSTGRPVAVKVTGLTALFARALNMRFHLWHGRDFDAKAASIAGRHLQSGAETERRGARVQWTPGYESGPMRYFDVMRPTAEQLDWLAREDPAYLVTYPSNLRALLEAARHAGIRPPGLREATLLGEVVDPDLPALARAVWGVPVSATYSAREAGVIAIECPEGRYHIQSESLLVELLDADGAPCPPGGIGRVVVTDLHNFAMPLIRYELGDYAEAGTDCRCGRTLPVLDRIMGRARNMLVLPSGERVWPFAFLADGLADIMPVRQFQLVQRSLEEIEVRLVVDRPPAPGAEDRLRDHLARAMRHPFRFTLHYVDDIPRGPGGKYEDFISDVAA